MQRILLLLITLFLVACVTPARLGISEAEWSNYTPEERAKIKQGYQETKRSKIVEKITPDGSVVKLQISGGQMNMPPFSGALDYSPFDVHVASGDCETVKVKERNGDKTVNVQICYYNKTVYVDPSRYDPSKSVGSIQLHYSPIWDRGFTYQHVSSSGYAHLNNVNIVVRRYDHNESIEGES